jgi:hypothetical protein
MTWTMTAVPPSELRKNWPTVAPLLAPAVGFSGGRISMSSVFDWLADQRYILWLAYQDGRIGAAFVTREAHYPCRKMLCIDIAGGSEMHGWVNEADRVFRAYAKAAGLDGVEIYGRAGWVRALKNLGWTGGTVLVETDTASGDEQ